MFEKIFSELGLSLNCQRIFSYLVENPPTHARQIAEHLDIPRPSIYDYLRILIEKGLITERYEENKRVFCIDDVKNIPMLLEQKIETLQTEKKKIEKVLPSLLNQTNFFEPKMKFYTGPEGMKQVLNQMMLYRDIETILMWPMSEMLSVFGKSYLENLNKQRIKQNISIRGIYPQDKKVNYKENPFLGIGGRHLREIRFAPKGMTWNMGYWLFKDKIAFLSSHKEGFGFIIHSKDLAELQKAQFEAIWEISKPAKPEPQHTDQFLKSIGEI